jgi:2-methylcitrate dehydratase
MWSQRFGQILEHHHCAINGYNAAGDYIIMTGDFFGLALDARGDVWIGGAHREARVPYARSGGDFWAAFDFELDAWPDRDDRDRTDDGVSAATSSAATEPEKWAPKTRETADHSIPYLVAYALQHGAITPHCFTAECLQDPAVRALIGTMRIDEDATFTERFCDEYNCQIEVTTTSGQRFSAAVTHPKGHWRNPLSDAEVESKFRALATEVLSAEQCDTALQQLWLLDQAANLQPLLDRLIVAP